MHIIIDTNVLISATFYAGFVKKILEELDAENFTICGNSKIIEESIAGFRDIATHNYDALRMRDVYDTIKYDFPELKMQIEKILESE